MLKEQITRVFPVLDDLAGLNDPLHNLRASDPPFGGFGQIAVTLEFSQAATGTVAGSLWAWNSSSTANDNDSTIIRPNVVSALAAGRWLRVMTNIR